MILKKKYMRRDGQKFVSIYRGDEMLVVIPHDDRANEIFNIYQKMEDERAAKEQPEEDGDDRNGIESLSAEFKNYFRQSWDYWTTILKEYPEKIEKIGFVCGKK